MFAAKCDVRTAYTVGGEKRFDVTLCDTVLHGGQECKLRIEVKDVAGANVIETDYKSKMNL